MGTMTQVTGNGPLEFTNANGKQISIPLSALYFDGNGTLQVDTTWATATGLMPNTGVLGYAQSEGLITPAPAPPPFASMIIKAADQGAGGNNIVVAIGDISPATDPTQTTFSITVTETDVYPGLTAATIESTLGSSTVSGSTLVPVKTGSSPGLVQVESGSVDTSGFPNTTDGSLSGDPAELVVENNDGSPAVVFTLLAKKAGADGATTQVDISPDTDSPPSSSDSTFTLTATWSRMINDVTLGTLASSIQSQFGYEITVSLPGSGAYSVPAASSSTLSGGTPGTSASATLFTGV
ncbi:MAG: hypothetical protein WAL75_18780 [Terracidiphilus sp.]